MWSILSYIGAATPSADMVFIPHVRMATCLPMSFTQYWVSTSYPANRIRRATVSPIMGFLARPTWNGPLGFALVCSMVTRPERSRRP